MSVNQPLSDKLLKLLEVMDSVPIGCVILNQNGEILYINIAANKILKIRYSSKYLKINKKLDTDPQYKTIIQELLTEKVVSDMKIKLNCFDNSFVNINLKASLFYGLEDVLIIQFNEIKNFVLIKYFHKIFNSIAFNSLKLKAKFKKLFSLLDKNIYVK